MTRRLLISGGAGFVGSHLVDRLLDRDDVASLTVVDDLSGGSRANLAHIADTRLSLVEVDITDFRSDALFDEIYHLASPVAPRDYMARPVATIAANVGGALLLLDRLAPGGRICFTSTSEIYGDPLVSPQRENDVGRTDPTGPRAAYVEAKRCTEALLLQGAATRGIEVRVARLFNSYGPRMHAADGRAIPNFIAAALADQPIQVYGDGLQSRSWGYIDDVVEALARFFWRDTHGFAGPLNIGNPIEVQVIDVARHVASLVEGARIAHGPALPDDPLRRCPDLALCQRILPGWRATIDYREGIAKTLAWVRAQS